MSNGLAGIEASLRFSSLVRELGLAEGIDRRVHHAWFADHGDDGDFGYKIPSTSPSALINC
jgi:hypothetical protein